MTPQLREPEGKKAADSSIVDICWTLKISRATFYRSIKVKKEASHMAP